MGSKLRFYRIDGERFFNWFEREKLPKPVACVDLRNVIIDRNFVENFEYQLKLSKCLQELRLKTDVAYLRLAKLTALRIVDIDLMYPLNVLSVISCPHLLHVTCQNLLIIDTSAYKVINLNYHIDARKLRDKKRGELNSHFYKIEQNFLNAFGLLSGPK